MYLFWIHNMSEFIATFTFSLYRSNVILYYWSQYHVSILQPQYQDIVAFFMLCVSEPQRCNKPSDFLWTLQESLIIISILIIQFL
ncbi:hypothetical protein FKM82_007928 [Ascaphus truei]